MIITVIDPMPSTADYALTTRDGMDRYQRDMKAWRVRQDARKQWELERQAMAQKLIKQLIEKGATHAIK